MAKAPTSAESTMAMPAAPDTEWTPVAWDAGVEPVSFKVVRDEDAGYVHLWLSAYKLFGTRRQYGTFATDLSSLDPSLGDAQTAIDNLITQANAITDPLA